MIDEDAIYTAIAIELETGSIDKGLWTRLFAECDGDENRTKVAYIKRRAEGLRSLDSENRGRSAQSLMSMNSPTLEQKREEAFCRENQTWFLNCVERYYPLDKNLISKFIDKWNWPALSANELLIWTDRPMEFIAHFEKQWDWQHLSANESIPWSEDLLVQFEDRWDWADLSCNKSLPWSLTLIEQYGHRWEWAHLSLNTAIPWSEELIHDARGSDEDWGWDALSLNSALPWSEKLIARFEDDWIWACLSMNKGIPWSEELISKFENQWDWEALSWNAALPWSKKFIARFKSRWNDSAPAWDSTNIEAELPMSQGLRDLYLEWCQYSADFKKAHCRGPSRFNLSRRQVESILAECFSNPDLIQPISIPIKGNWLPVGTGLHWLRPQGQ